MCTQSDADHDHDHPDFDDDGRWKTTYCGSRTTLPWRRSASTSAPRGPRSSSRGSICGGLAEDLTSRYYVVARETLFQSPVALTPYLNEQRIDGARARRHHRERL